MENKTCPPKTTFACNQTKWGYDPPRHRLRAELPVPVGPVHHVRVPGHAAHVHPVARAAGEDRVGQLGVGGHPGVEEPLVVGGRAVDPLRVGVALVGRVRGPVQRGLQVVPRHVGDPAELLLFGRLEVALRRESR